MAKMGLSSKSLWLDLCRETCLLLEVEVTDTPEAGQAVKFVACELLIFSEGMNCRWDLYQAVRKHYRFGD